MAKYNVKMKVLSPIHIGNGLKYYLTTFLIVNGIGYKIHPKKFFLKLKDVVNKETNQSLTQLFIDTMTNETYDFNLNSFLAKNKKYIKLNIKDNCIEYSIPLITLGIARKNQEGKSLKNEFQEAIKDSKNNFYIPGSSIKGAIRTALLFNNIDENNLKQKKIDFYNAYKEENKVIEDLEVKTDDKEDNVMRFIHVSDTDTTNNATLREQRNIGMGNTKGVLNYCETIDENTELNFSLNIIEKGLKNLNQKQKEMITIDNIKKSIYIFSNEILNFLETKIIQKQEKSKENLNSLREQIRKLKVLNSENSPIILLGRYKGFYGSTLFLELKNLPGYDKIFLNTKNIPHPGSKKGKKHDPKNFPVSLNVFLSKEGTWILPGWAKLEFEEV